jgi:hypothetical protein
VLRSSYDIAYIESVGKAIYYINAYSLYDVAEPGNPELTYTDPDFCRTQPKGVCGSPIPGGGLVGEPYSDLATGEFNCSLLGNYPDLTVADLLKKDLGDSSDTGNAAADENNVCLDNQFGPNQQCTQTPAQLAQIPIEPGKLALRCALKELMKPFNSAGVLYFADVVKETGSSTAGGEITVPQQPPPPTNGQGNIYPGWQRVTNSYVADANGLSSCEDIENQYTSLVTGDPNSPQVDILTSAVPFRVPRTDSVQDFFAMTLRICVWNSQTSSILPG